MNDNGTFYVCAACRERVEPDTPGIVRAGRLIAVPGYGGGIDEPIEGEGVFLHARHYPPYSRMYRRTD